MIVLNSEHLANVAHESINAEQVELLPTFPQFDSVIYQIGMLFQMELKSDGTQSKLYLDGLTTALSAHLLRQYCTTQQPIRNHENRFIRGGDSRYSL